MGQDCCKGGSPTPDVEFTATNEKATLEFLSKVQLFKRLPTEEHSKLASICKVASFAPGQVVIRQGDEGNEFFVIKSGSAAVEVDGNKVASLKDGDYFGENALLRDEPRMATIKAASKLECLKVTRADFHKLGLNEKLEFQQRKAVGGGADGDVVTQPPSSKTPDDKKVIIDALKANTNLQTIVPSGSDAWATALCDLMWEETVPAGTDKIVEGDLNADYFYVVKSGKFEITKTGEAASAESAASAPAIGSIEKGGSFGELALLYFAPRAATIKATADAIVWVVDRKNFKQILAKSSDDMAAEYIKYLDKVDILAPLKSEEKRALAKALVEMSFEKDEEIFKQGEKGEIFYILIDGTVSVIKDNKETAKLTATATTAQFFGERALMTNEARTATIKVLSGTAKSLTCDRDSFNMLLGPLEELKKRGKDGTAKVNKQAAPSGADGGKRFGNILRKDLKRLGLLGCGGFGAVEMVEHVTTGDTYALKALSKGYVVKSGMQASVMSEKNVQLLCDSPFVVKLYETYNGQQSLYLLLELALGGELYATYNKKCFHGREGHAKFYVAGTVLAFEHLHSKKIIFRDLKPENLLLNDKGHVKLTDMGLAKVVIGKTYTTCGTPDYFAPELIASTGHTNAVDWWCLGILAFELMVGHPPFESPTPMQIYQKVTKGINRVAFPAKCKGPCEDFIKNLCKKEPSERLPMRKGGSDNIKNHRWYQDFNWQTMLGLTMDPPYKPAVKSKKDIANFSARKEDMPPQVPYKDDKSGWDKDFATST